MSSNKGTNIHELKSVELNTSTLEIISAGVMRVRDGSCTMCRITPDNAVRYKRAHGPVKGLLIDNNGRLDISRGYDKIVAITFGEYAGGYSNLLSRMCVLHKIVDTKTNTAVAYKVRIKLVSINGTFTKDIQTTVGIEVFYMLRSLIKYVTYIDGNNEEQRLKTVNSVQKAEWNK